MKTEVWNPDSYARVSEPPASLTGWRLAIVQPVGSAGQPDADPLVAVDSLGCSPGQRVLVNRIGARFGEPEVGEVLVCGPVRVVEPCASLAEELCPQLLRVDAGVARSRSEALAWCVRLVGRHSDEWLAELREAMSHVADVRAKGPAA